MNGSKFKLFIYGRSSANEKMIRNMRRICREKGCNAWDLAVIDVSVDPGPAALEKVFVTPTLVEKNRWRKRRWVGDLSVRERVLSGLDMS